MKIGEIFLYIHTVPVSYRTTQAECIIICPYKHKNMVDHDTCAHMRHSKKDVVIIQTTEPIIKI